MIRALIADDEQATASMIEYFIKESGAPVTIAGIATNGGEAVELIRSLQPDLVFLDIQMPGMNGIELARILPKQTLIIFTTAYSEYALDSYEVDAIDYLVKPIDPTKFRKAVNKAITYHSLLMDEEEKSVENVEEDFIFVKSDRRFFKVNFKDVLFIEGLKDYVIIQMETQRIITRMNIKTIHELLPKKIFLRINKSYIINRNKIESFNNNDVFMKTYEIAIGNSYRDEFFKEITKGTEAT